MPADIRIRLAERNLTDAYRGRPADQKVEYVAWIEGAKLSLTRNRRIGQMLDELASGDRFMDKPFNSGSENPLG